MVGDAGRIGVVEAGAASSNLVPWLLARSDSNGRSWEASMRVDDGITVSRSGVIRGQEAEVGDAGLGDQHSIEGIAVVPGQPGNFPSVGGCERQAFKRLVSRISQRLTAITKAACCKSPIRFLASRGSAG